MSSGGQGQSDSFVCFLDVLLTCKYLISCFIHAWGNLGQNLQSESIIGVTIFKKFLNCCNPSISCFISALTGLKVHCHHTAPHYSSNILHIWYLWLVHVLQQCFLYQTPMSFWSDQFLDIWLWYIFLLAQAHLVNNVYHHFPDNSVDWNQQLWIFFYWISSRSWQKLLVFQQRFWKIPVQVEWFGRDPWFNNLAWKINWQWNRGDIFKRLIFDDFKDLFDKSFRIFLPLRYYVKSIFVLPEVQKLPFLRFQRLWILSYIFAILEGWIFTKSNVQRLYVKQQIMAHSAPLKP